MLLKNSMRLQERAIIPVIVALTTACTGRGETAAQQWLERQTDAKQQVRNLPGIPEVTDTLPVAYNPELYADPFTKSWGKTTDNQPLQDSPGNPRVRFPDVEVMNLKINGFITSTNGIAAMVSSNRRFESIRVGDLIGSAGWAVQAFSSAGIELRAPDGSQLLLAFQKQGSRK